MREVERVALYHVGPKHVELRREKVGGPLEGEVLVRAIASAISAGTELLFYRDQVGRGLRLDAIIKGLQGTFQYPFKYGYSTVGEIEAVGEGVDRALVGRRAFAFHPHESHFLASLEDLHLVPEGIATDDALFLASMETGLSLATDGQPAIGEDVMVFGQGVMGLLTTFVLSRYPLGSLTAVDAFPLRRRMSVEMGAEDCLGVMEPAELLREVGLDDDKLDLVFEISGNPSALNEAIAVTGQEGRLVLGSWYGEKEVKLDLSRDFHRNRIKIIGSQVSSMPPFVTGRWDKGRRYRLAWSLIQKARPSRLITHRHPFMDAPGAFEMLNRNPEESIQVIFDYTEV
ncbi:MAG TPA: zinc-binding dehydrogenase [Methanomassiliicoccales archaeon]|nr:zinc-binding dehydrogenase [Methanomassiliicoccales archaeon]